MKFLYIKRPKKISYGINLVIQEVTKNIRQIIANSKGKLVWHPANYGISINKNVLTIHDCIGLSFGFREHIIKKILRWIYFYCSVISATRIVVPSFYTRQCVLKIAPFVANKLLIIKNGETLHSGFLKKIKANKQTKKIPKKFLLCVSNSLYHKGLIDLLSVYDPQGSLPLVIVGKLNSWHKSLAKKKKIYLLQNVGTKKLNWLYLKTAGCIAPSINEGFGLPGCTCKTLGKPLLARDIPIFREIYKTYPIYFKDRSDLKLKLRYFYKKTTAKKYSEWSWSDCAKDYQKVFLELLHDTKR